MEVLLPQFIWEIQSHKIEGNDLFQLHLSEPLTCYESPLYLISCAVHTDACVRSRGWGTVCFHWRWLLCYSNTGTHTASTLNTKYEYIKGVFARPLLFLT